MGGVVTKITDGIGLTNSNAERNAEAQARAQRATYEAQARQQAEQAKLDSNKSLDNVTKVNSGDALAAAANIDSTQKKKQTGAGGISSALGL